MLRSVLFRAIFVAVTFSFLPPSPQAGDDNLMQEVNQNLAEEVRIVEFYKFLIVL